MLLKNLYLVCSTCNKKEKNQGWTRITIRSSRGDSRVDTASQCSTSIGRAGNAVTQKSPCEGNRVIMGEESALKLSQRGPDARQGGAHENPEAIIRPRAQD